MAIGTSRNRVLSLSDSRSRENPLEALSSFCLSLRALHGIYLIPRSSESGALRGALRGFIPSSLPRRFLSLTKCLPVLYFTVSSALGKKLTDENLFFLVSGKWSDALFPENNAWLFADFPSIFNQRLEVRKERYNFRSITADSDCQIDFTSIHHFDFDTLMIEI